MKTPTYADVKTLEALHSVERALDKLRAVTDDYETDAATRHWLRTAVIKLDDVRAHLEARA